ncbi:hypothetical protein L6164_023581 [Bauhinia variegata]|uniref:Uncharacterized protein n=1 Tax=Bauhinia variegata TaxID=167791 RepID=A0ACB9MIL4_BAUVA|nr:hypothetical protein L6164_023581 [Bauhinia variegata]
MASRCLGSLGCCRGLRSCRHPDRSRRPDRCCWVQVKLRLPSGFYIGVRLSIKYQSYPGGCTRYPMDKDEECKSEWDSSSPSRFFSFMR